VAVDSIQYSVINEELLPEEFRQDYPLIPHQIVIKMGKWEEDGW
jgi:hypothetical protein